MLRRVKFSAMLITLSFCTLPVSPVRGVDDHRVEVKIEKEVKIVPAGAATRAMMSMVQHPDGTIFLNAQTESPRLYKSSDNGETWSAAPVKLTGAPPNQSVQGLGVSRSGRLFVIHVTRAPAVDGLYGQSLFISYSDDGGRTWARSSFDFGQAVRPGLPNMMFHEDGNRTFIEQPDGTMMFTTTIVPSPKYKEKYPAQQPYGPPNYESGGQPGDLFSDIVFRSTDGGVTWGDPTQVYPDLNPHESALAIGPQDPDRILVMTRIQRLGRPEEDAEAMMKKTGNPQHYWKQGALFESTDGGRTFRLPEGGFTQWYGHRGTIGWSKNNVVILTHSWGQKGDVRRAARISLDGGETWVDGTKSGTPLMNQSTKFQLTEVAGFTAPTIELSRNRFLTAVYHYHHVPGIPHEWKDVIGGVIWHLDGPGAE